MPQAVRAAHAARAVAERPAAGRMLELARRLHHRPFGGVGFCRKVWRGASGLSPAGLSCAADIISGHEHRPGRRPHFAARGLGGPALEGAAADAVPAVRQPGRLAGRAGVARRASGVAGSGPARRARPRCASAPARSAGVGAGDRGVGGRAPGHGAGLPGGRRGWLHPQDGAFCALVAAVCSAGGAHCFAGQLPAAERGAGRGPAFFGAPAGGAGLASAGLEQQVDCPAAGDVGIDRQDASGGDLPQAQCRPPFRGHGGGRAPGLQIAGLVGDAGSARGCACCPGCC
eukprot:284814628_2